MSEIPDHLEYTPEHEWLWRADGVATVGITAVATAQLGDLVFVQLPDVGVTVTLGKVCGEVESTKSVSDLFSPVSGAVTEINQAAVADPAVVNTDPYGEGWLFRVTVTEVGPVLSAQEYRSLTDAG